MLNKQQTGDSLQVLIAAKTVEQAEAAAKSRKTVSSTLFWYGIGSPPAVGMGVIKCKPIVDLTPLEALLYASQAFKGSVLLIPPSDQPEPKVVKEVRDDLRMASLVLYQTTLEKAKIRLGTKEEGDALGELLASKTDLPIADLWENYQMVEDPGVPLAVSGESLSSAMTWIGKDWKVLKERGMLEKAYLCYRVLFEPKMVLRNYYEYWKA